MDTDTEMEMVCDMVKYMGMVMNKHCIYVIVPFRCIMY